MPLTHLDSEGNAIMVDVGEKAATQRRAVAAGRIRMNEQAFSALKAGAVKKGDVLAVARVAGIMAAKQTSSLIPLCHPLPITQVGVDFHLLEDVFQVEAVCTVSCTGQTGVEMEALTGATTALLTIYDMCKALDRGMVIDGVSVRLKTGGKSGTVLPQSP